MTTALQEIVDRYERLVLSFGGADVDNLKHLISRARAELERGVDVHALAVAAGVLLNDTGTLHAIHEELQRQGIPTTTRQPHVP